jgi:hypothetical protein
VAAAIAAGDQERREVPASIRQDGELFQKVNTEQNLFEGRLFEKVDIVKNLPNGFDRTLKFVRPNPLDSLIRSEYLG